MVFRWWIHFVSLSTSGSGNDHIQWHGSLLWVFVFVFLFFSSFFFFCFGFVLEGFMFV